jgi:two-component system sensor histidine kinase UhpB
VSDSPIAPRATMQDEVAAPLQRRLSPLVMALSSLLAVGAPVAHHVVGARELRADCVSIAARAVEELAHDAQERPKLWRYDAIKVVDHLRSYRAQSAMAALQVFDANGIAVGAAPARGAHLWCSHTMRVRGEDVGTVWVAMHLRALRATTLGLLAVFTTLAFALGWLVYALSMRTARSAASKIDSLVSDLERSRARLAELNAGLERDVAARTRELDEAYAELRTTAARAVTLQENERRAIGRDLHDSVGQALTAIRIHAQLASELAPHTDDTSLQREVLAKVCATTDAALEELRRALARLGPAVLDEVGLEAALNRAIDAFIEQTGCRVERSLSVARGLEPAVEVAIYRITQESLTNIARHAEASCVKVKLSFTDVSLRLVIEDDGKGMDKSAKTLGRGLHGMRERAALLRGSFAVSAGEGGRGTKIDVQLPRAQMVTAAASAEPS